MLQAFFEMANNRLDWSSPVCCLMKLGEEHLFELAMDAGKSGLFDFDIDVFLGPEEETSLIYATRLGRHRMVKMLLDAEDVDINAEDNTGRTVYMWALKQEDEKLSQILEVAARRTKLPIRSRPFYRNIRVYDLKCRIYWEDTTQLDRQLGIELAYRAKTQQREHSQTRPDFVGHQKLNRGRNAPNSAIKLDTMLSDANRVLAAGLGSQNKLLAADQSWVQCGSEAQLR
jgi:ankyrin repeat protein